MIDRLFAWIHALVCPRYVRGVHGERYRVRGGPR